MDTTTQHHVELTRTRSDIPDVADALHLRCECGWTSSAPDDDAAQRITDEHLASGDPAPVPSTISPT